MHTSQQHGTRWRDQRQVVKLRGGHTRRGLGQAPHIDQGRQQHLSVSPRHIQKLGGQVDFYEGKHLGIAFTDTAGVGPVHLPLLQLILARLEQVQQASAGVQIRLKAENRYMSATSADGGYGKGEIMVGRQ